MPRHANQTSFKKGQKIHPSTGKKMGVRKGTVPWNKGIKQWPNGLPESMRKKISQANAGKPHWWGWSKIEMASKKCENCGEEFTVYPPSDLMKQRFCSYHCSNSSRSVETHRKAAVATAKTNRERGHYETVRIRMKNGGAVKARNACKPPSRFQKEVFDHLKELHPDAVLEYWINSKTDGIKSVDIYIPSRGLIIECDGDYWHKNIKERDEIRQLQIEKLGYRVVRIPELEWKKDKNIYRYI